MSFRLVYLSTGIMDTAFDSRVLPVLEATMRSGMPVIHVAVEPFRQDKTEAHEKAKVYLTKGIEATPKGTPKSEELRWVIQDLERKR